MKWKIIQVNDETFKYQSENSHIQNFNNENKFLPCVDLSRLLNDQRNKVEKRLVEEFEVFSKDEHDIGCIESLQLKSNVKGNTRVSQPYRWKLYIWKIY